MPGPEAVPDEEAAVGPDDVLSLCVSGRGWANCLRGPSTAASVLLSWATRSRRGSGPLASSWISLRLSVGGVPSVDDGLGVREDAAAAGPGEEVGVPAALCTADDLARLDLGATGRVPGAAAAESEGLPGWLPALLSAGVPALLCQPGANAPMRGLDVGDDWARLFARSLRLDVGPEPLEVFFDVTGAESRRTVRCSLLRASSASRLSLRRDVKLADEPGVGRTASLS